MTESLWLYVALVVLVGFERVAELAVSLRNAKWSFAHGGVEFGKGHYPFMVVLHTGLLAGCVVEAIVSGRPFDPKVGWAALVIVLLMQGLRWWCISVLGYQWNTRVIVVPGLSRVTRGPYRLLRHPNYVAVIGEGIALPLVHSAYITAIVFTLLNAPLLAVRIRTEETALGTVLAK
ncbi:isoprenylcysteine carboxyl methyltransferase family protein [Kribbella kalugense]|uniref:Alkylresorcinol O-methyltransferase n=1 Tax=Kribbella kalugense TaxID=2512221 RepID=A0A4R8A600_9ACTN|nr:isoprenylcysteine carboxyl methyltransferase family protein [Kribbella kalugense]TDW23700.1 alkylresorcinol O-methyltransferase [Kribbella kalugense]